MSDIQRPLAAHDLGDGCTFYVGRVPKELEWAGATFDDGWNMHPPEKHKIMIDSRPPGSR